MQRYTRLMSPLHHSALVQTKHQSFQWHPFPWSKSLSTMAMGWFSVLTQHGQTQWSPVAIQGLHMLMHQSYLQCSTCVITMEHCITNLLHTTACQLLCFSCILLFQQEMASFSLKFQKMANQNQWILIDALSGTIGFVGHPHHLTKLSKSFPVMHRWCLVRG